MNLQNTNIRQDNQLNLNLETPSVSYTLNNLGL